jgi:hypothetical protein
MGEAFSVRPAAFVSRSRILLSAQGGTLVVRGQMLVAERRQVSLRVGGAAANVVGRSISAASSR